DSALGRRLGGLPGNGCDHGKDLPGPENRAPASGGDGMTHLLDSNICAAHFRRPAGLAHRFIQYGGGLFVPTIVLGELYAGAYHVSNPAPLLQKIADLLNDVQVLSFDLVCAEEFGKVRGRLLQQGISIPTADLMIAAVALV